MQTNNNSVVDMTWTWIRYSQWGGVVSAGGTTNGTGAVLATATCDAGLVVVGGGASVSDQNNAYINDAYPQAPASFSADAFGAAGTAFTVFAICAPAAATQ